jgi:hypothetical protein
VLADVIAFFTQSTSAPSTSTNYAVMPRNTMMAPPGQDLAAPLSRATGVSTTPMSTATYFPLGVDNALRDCFEDLQHFHDAYGGDGPIRQLSQDWLHEIGGMALHAVQLWGE